MINSLLFSLLVLVHSVFCQYGGFPQYGYGYNTQYISPYGMQVGSYGATNMAGYGYPYGTSPYGYGMGGYQNFYSANGGYGSYGSYQQGGGGRMSSFLSGAMEGVMLGATLGMAG